MKQNNSENGVKIILSNQIGYERIAMACSETFAQMFGFAPDRIEDLKTIVSEAAINAMEHGNKGRPHSRVIVSMNFNNNAINVSVTDEGKGFKTFPPKPNIERIIDHLDPPIGFGIFLIKQLADKVEFSLAPNKGHVVNMSINMA
jgi:serine/threonine-protein kinase RsbW